MKKNTFLFSLFMLMFLADINAQNSRDFFKVYQTPSSSDPQWVQLMYSNNPNVFEVDDAYNNYYKTNSFEKNIHTQNYKHWRRLVQPFINNKGFIVVPSDAEQAKKWEMLKANKGVGIGKQPTNFGVTNTTSTSAKNTLPWTCAGPNTIYSIDGSQTLMPHQSNVYCIGVAPSNTNIVYCLTESGGLFKTVDKCMNWTLMSKNEVFTNGQSIAVDPFNPNKLYIAFNNKIFKSVDGAVTWTLSNTFSKTVEKILIKKSYTDSVFAATDAGLYLTTNGGVSWNLTSLPNWCWDIVANPKNPKTMYASTSVMSGTKNLRAEVYKTVNGGATWTLKNTSWYQPTDVNAAMDYGCKLGTTMADTNRVYAALIGWSKAGDNGWIGVYYSTNGAGSWVNPDGIDGGPYVPGMTTGTNWFFAGYGGGYDQGWYNFALGVSQINPDKIWVGTIWIMESGNRGQTLEYLRQAPRNLNSHADIQDIQVVGNEIFLASDGGINYSNDEMQTASVRSKGLTASEFWGFDQGWNEDVWVGGRYHNGNAAYYEKFGVGNALMLGGAESPTGHVNVFNNRKVYTNDAGSVQLPTALNQPVVSINSPAIFPNGSYTPLASSSIKYDYRYANVMYLGSNNIFYKSTDGGANFSALFTFPTGSWVYDFELSRSNPNYMYCVVNMGSNVYKIYKSVDAGMNFTVLTTLPNYTKGNLDITLNPSNENNIWAINMWGSNGNKVFTSADGGSTWVNKTTSVLDNNTPYDIVMQAGIDSLVYLATESNVFVYDKDVSNWVSYGNGLPLVLQPLTMKPFYRDNKLRLSTMRGIWEVPLYQKSLPVAQPMTLNKNVTCKETVQFESYSVAQADTSTHWQWSFSPTPTYISSSTVRNPQVIFGNSGDFSVTLKVSHGTDVSTKTETNMIHVNGCNPDTLPGLSFVCNNTYAQTDPFNVTTNTFTVSAWIKPKGLQNEYSGIVFNDGDKCGLNISTGNQLGFHWAGVNWWWNSGLVLDSTKWNHVAMVVEPTKVTLYLNGVPSALSYAVPTSTITSMKIGSYQGWTDRNFKGEIDEVCIWNRSLSQNAIRQSMHLTKMPNDGYTGYMLAYYQFNEPTTMAYSSIGAINATLSSGSTRTISTAPVGIGEISRQSVTAAGTYTFGNTGLKVGFGAVNPNGELVVTRLHNLPDSVGYSVGTNPLPCYWIVDNYGANKTFTNVSSLELQPTKPLAAQIVANPFYAALNKRGTNEHLNNWVYLSGASSAANNALQYGSGIGLNALGQLHAVSWLDISAPVKILSFDVALNATSKGVITWNTGNETNITTYEVEKSMNMIEWNKIATVPPINFGANNNYQITDENVAQGKTFYRVKQINANGSINYTEIKSIEYLPASDMVSVYPVPTNGPLFVKNLSNSNFKITFFNMEGKIVKDIYVKDVQTQIDLSSLASGEYFYRIVSDLFIKNGKVILIK